MARFQRVLLIHPRYPAEYDFHILPVGVGYISHALSKADIPNTVVDMQLGYELSTLKQRIREFEPDIVGLSMMSFGYPRNYQLLEKIKQWFPNIKTVVGGPHMIMGEKVLQECSIIDFGVVGEGEETIVELCGGESPVSAIKGLVYRETIGEVIYAGNRPFIADYDANGFPTFAEFEMEKYDNRIMHVATSRGCPYKCIYCSAGGTKIRLRRAVSVADEFEYWYARGYRNFRIVDDNFTFRAKRVFEICDEFENRGLTGLKIVCANGVRADKVTREMLRRMRGVGFTLLSFGVEGGSDRILKRLKKGETIDAIKRAINDACELGYMVSLFFLVGSPGETEADVRQSVNLAKEYPICGANFYNIIPFPNTELFDWVSQNDYFVRDPGEYLANSSHWVNDPFFETPELSVEKRKELVSWANRTISNHALRVKKKFYSQDLVARLQGLGVPAMLRQPLVELNFTPLFQRVFRETGLVRRAKTLLALVNSDFRRAVSDTSLWNDSIVDRHRR